MTKKIDSFLAICDKPNHIVQILGFEKIRKEINFVNFGENLIVVALDINGKTPNIEKELRQELDECLLFNATVIKYQPDELVYTGVYSKVGGLQALIRFIREKIQVKVPVIFCADLQLQIVKIHLDAFPKAEVFLLEDGLTSYLEKSVKECTSWGSYYAHRGIVLAHLQRVKQANLMQEALGIPRCYINTRRVNINFCQNKFSENEPKSQVYLGLNADSRAIMTFKMQDFWLRKSDEIDLSQDYDAVIIGQNLSDFCRDFYFRNEVELYLQTCETLLKKFDKLLFVLDTPYAERIMKLMKEKLSNSNKVNFWVNGNTPIESLIIGKDVSKPIIGFYSHALWTIKNILEVDSVYTALGWNTVKLYNEIAYEMHKQSYRKARLDFYPLHKLMLD